MIRRLGEGSMAGSGVATGQCLPGASRVSSRAATLKYLVAANDDDEL